METPEKGEAWKHLKKVKNGNPAGFSWEKNRSFFSFNTEKN